MDEDCAFFPELYRLWDREHEKGVPISATELRNLVDLCTHCGLCPCPNIPAGIMEAKSLYVEKEGLTFAVRVLSDVPRLARLCGTFPKLVNSLQSNTMLAPLLRKATRVHPERQFPAFPERNFFQWAAEKGLHDRHEGSRQVSYFAGCSAGYLFPEVGRAVVAVLERNDVKVQVPKQGCCGMPHLVEGNRTAALQQVRSNVEHLQASVDAGDDIICSCPTCGFYLKVLLKERACYSEAYQRSINAGENEIVVPDRKYPNRKPKVLRKATYKDILKDDGYFSALDPMARIGLAEQVSDAGEYLARLHAEGHLDVDFQAIPGHMVYFAPCHQREQNIGRPYLDLLRLIPGLTIKEPRPGMGCCGMGGNFGFKVDFHDKSLATGRLLMDRIRGMDPDAIITDCLSCSLQFRHALPYPVFHPMEILDRAYRKVDALPA